jgi:hypothetical protein
MSFRGPKNNHTDKAFGGKGGASGDEMWTLFDFFAESQKGSAP